MMVIFVYLISQLGCCNTESQKKSSKHISSSQNICRIYWILFWVDIIRGYQFLSQNCFMYPLPTCLNISKVRQFHPRAINTIYFFWIIYIIRYKWSSTNNCCQICFVIYQLPLQGFILQISHHSGIGSVSDFYWILAKLCKHFSD